MIQLQLVLEILRSDFVKGTGGDTRCGNAQFFGFRENFFVLQAEFL
jgi:hypothetical protein